jgi:hypothetical protein
MERIGPGVVHDGRLADRRPCCAGVIVRADPGLISELDQRTILLGRRPDSRVLLNLPPPPPRGSADRRGAADAATTGLVRNPTLTTDSATENSRRMTWRTISRVHNDRLAMQTQPHEHILRMRTRLHLLHRPDPQHLKRPMIQLATVVIPHPREIRRRVWSTAPGCLGSG